jgi:hypothetical protein
MKDKRTEEIRKIILQNMTIDESLNGKYDDDPLLNEKTERASRLVEKFGIPEEFKSKVEPGSTTFKEPGE